MAATVIGLKKCFFNIYIFNISLSIFVFGGWDKEVYRVVELEVVVMPIS